MKKLISLLLALIIVMSAASVFAEDIAVTVNGEAVEFDQAPELIDEVLMLPLRFIAEKLNANVNWYGETQTVFTDCEGTISTIQINNENLFIGDEAVKLEKAPMLKNDRTLVPAAVIEKGTGATIVWDKDNLTVTITK